MSANLTLKTTSGGSITLAPTDTAGNYIVTLPASSGALGGISDVTVATANGFSGASSGGATPILTLATSVTGILKGSGSVVSAAVAGTDYLAPGGAGVFSTVTASSKVLVGATTSAYTQGLQLYGSAANGPSNAFQWQYSANTTAANLLFVKTRGATATDLTPVISGDLLGSITFSGPNSSSAIVSAAGITAGVDGTVTATDVPTSLSFQTGTTTGNTRMTISSAGLVTVVGTLAANTLTPTNALGVAYGGTGVTTSTGTGSTVLSASPTFTGTLAAAAITASTTLGVTGISTLTGGAVVEGVTVGKGVGAIATNTALGRNALSGSNSGAFNTAVGESALVTNTTGAANSALGNSTLNTNNIGSYNLAAGASAMYYNTSGSSNTGVGRAALQNNTIGSNNIALGADSGTGLTTGSNNTIIGSVAGTAGLANTVIIAAGTTEKMRIDSANIASLPGNLLVGGPIFSGFAQGLQLYGNTANGTQNTFQWAYGGTNVSTTYLIRSRATTATGNTAVINGDVLGSYGFGGTDGTNTGGGLPNITATAAVTCIVDGAVSANTVPSSLVLSTGTTVATSRMVISSAGVVSMSNYGAGTATFSASGVISSVSDETLKIKDGVVADPIPMIMALEPGYYFGKPEANMGPGRQLGFYAQNVRAAIGPEAAPDPESKTAEDGTVTTKPWGYFDRSVLAVAVEAIKVQQVQIIALTARIAALEAK